MKGAAGYSRVSSEDQSRDGYSIPDQGRKITQYCEQDGLDLGVIFYDEKSGTTLDRPGLNSLLDYLDCHESVENVIFLDPDRVSRRLAGQLALDDEFELRGITQHFVFGRYDNSPEGKAFKHMKGVFDEYEWEKIRRRTMRGKRAKALAGKVVGSGVACFGFDYTHEDKGAQEVRAGYEPNEARATVLQMYEWCFYDELRCYGIAKRLTEAGILTPTGGTVWSPVTVKHILTNPVYDGRWYYGKTKQGKPVPKDEWIKVKVPRIVPHDLWEGVQAKLQRRGRKHSAKAKYDYLLTRRISCECGKPRVGHSSIPRGKVYRYYVCPDASKGCDSKGIPASEAEDFVLLCILRLLTLPNVLWDWLKKLKGGIEDENESLKKKLEELGAKERKLEQKMERCRNLYLDGVESKERLYSKEQFYKDGRKIQKDLARIRDDQEFLEQRLKQPISEERIRILEDYFHKLAEKVGIPGLDEWAGGPTPKGFRGHGIAMYGKRGETRLSLSGFADDHPLRRKLDSLTFQEKRMLVQSMGIAVSYIDGTFKVHAFRPERGFRVIDNVSGSIMM